MYFVSNGLNFFLKFLKFVLEVFISFHFSNLLLLSRSIPEKIT
jgi:hypothetical protein